MQTGAEFLIFQDRNDIAWGQNWQQRIDQTLDSVTLLIVIITPSFFRSPACRTEVERFLSRERELGRQDLILPVYYVETPELDDLKLRDADELAQLVASRQFADWRELRFEPFTSPLVRKALAQLARRICDSFWHPPTDVPVRHGEAMAEVETRSAEPTTAAEVTVKTEPPTHVVDPYQQGNFATIGAAIRSAQPGDRILVRPGLYLESLIIDKPLEILGDGPTADIQIQARNAPVLRFWANIGRIANLTLRQAAGGKWRGQWSAVDITQGRLELEGCDITSQSLQCVTIRTGGNPTLRRNRIHHSKQTGVYVYDGGLGTLEDNEITGNVYAGVSIANGGNPTLRRNQIHDNKQNGVYVYSNGMGTLEDNEISGNLYSGVTILTGGNPTLRRNQIHHNANAGVYVCDSGLGTLEDNEITANNGTGVNTKTGGKPTLRRNRINRNGKEAVAILDGGCGVFEENDLTGSSQGFWSIAEDCEGNVTRAHNRE